jgi:hypothetical protein
MGVEVTGAPSGIRYGGTDYTPGAASFTLSDGPTTTTNTDDDRRADVVYFDSSAGNYGVFEGTPNPYPQPPTPPADGLLLAVVSVPHNATDIGDDAILNWRPRPTVAGEVPIADADDEFAGDTVEAALSASSQGLSDLSDYDVAGNTVVDGAATIYDATAGTVPNAIVEGFANFPAGAYLSAYPLSLATDTNASQYPLSFAKDTEATGYPLEFGTDVAYNTLADGTITFTGGSPTSFSVSGLTATEASTVDVAVGVDTSPAWSADYAFNFEWSHRYDSTTGDVAVDIQLTWDIDPGAGNDLTLTYSVTSR